MKKKILYIGGFDLPDNNAAAQRVIANSKLFHHLGYEILLVGLTRDISNSKSPFLYRNLRCINLQYPKSIGKWFSYLTSIGNYKQYIIEYNPDIVIAYNHPSIALEKLRIFCQSKGKKIVSDCTEWYLPQGNVLFKLLKGLDISYRMRFVHKKMDGMIVISDYLENYYSCCKNVLLLPPLVDKLDEKWERASQYLKEKSSNIVRLVYAGSPGKGNKDQLNIIIDVLEKIHNTQNLMIEFVIIGITLIEFNRIYSVNKTIPSFVHFLGRMNHMEVLRELYCSDFQIFIRECNLANTAGFPTKFVESISSNLLVVSNYSSDLSKYLIEGENGFKLDISTEDSLYDSLSTILKKDIKYIRYLKSKIDSNVFDYRNFTAKTIVFLESLN